MRKRVKTTANQESKKEAKSDVIRIYTDRRNTERRAENMEQKLYRIRRKGFIRRYAEQNRSDKTGLVGETKETGVIKQEYKRQRV